MAGIRIENIIKTLPGSNKPIFNGISLEIQDGEIMIIAGQSGCGKTTFLKIIAGIEDIEGGCVYLGNRLVNSGKPRLKTQTAAIFQHYTMYKWSLMNKIIPKFFYYNKWVKTLYEERIKVVSDIMKISPDEIKGKITRNISKGQQQRLDLARYLISQKEMFLLDDPLVGMDTIIRNISKAELRKILKTLKITTLYIPSIHDEILEIGDRMAILEDGNIRGPFSIQEAQKNPDEKLHSYLKG